MIIRFMWNGIKTEDGQLHKASYSMGQLAGQDEGTITIYGKHYRSFPWIDGLTVENGSDVQSDHFENDCIRVAPDSPHYTAVLEALNKHEAKRAHLAKFSVATKPRKPPLPPAVCPICGKSFLPRGPIHRFCSEGCRKQTRISCGLKSGIPSGTIGAIHELLVVNHLLRAGLDVFRAVSPSCPCDLAVSDGNMIWRVEVKTTQRHLDGHCIYRDPKGMLGSGRYDVLAMVLVDGILFEPDPWGASTTLKHVGKRALEPLGALPMSEVA